MNIYTEQRLEYLRAELAVARRDKARLTEDMRGIARGTKQLVFFGGRGCLTDYCSHWGDDTCNREDPYCRIGRTIEIALVKEKP